MDSGQISGLSGVIIGTILSALVSVVGGAILAHIVAWKIALVLFSTSPIVILAGFLRIRIVAKIEEKNRQAYTESATWATEACSNIRTVAALGTEKAASERFRRAVDKYRDQTFKDTIIGNILLSFALAITYFVYALAYWWGSKQVREGHYTTLQFFIVMPAILFSSQAAGQLFSLAPDLGRARAAAARVFALHDQKPTIDVPWNNSSSSFLTLEKTSQRCRIEFKDVCLTYESRPNMPVFTNLNLTINAGETVALVGRSGAGKSSMVALLERFYDPISGAILLDGQDIRSMPVSQHRARLSLVSQDPDLFSGSIAFNVGLGAKPGHVATREEVIEACQAVGIHDFVQGLPDGYETQCGNNGSQLSGGQKQRVAIARAYIRNPEILLLDEATSALDSHSEAQIQKAIWAASRKRTTIMVAHRLTTVQGADRILVFERGKIVEEGRHEDLVRRGGIYGMMVKAQSMG